MSIEKPPSGARESATESFELLALPDTIIVTSASEIKINTVKKALQEFFPKRTFNVLGVKATSGINEQPVGDETERGAYNRIQNAELVAEGDATRIPRAFMSIENGIFPREEGVWEDKAVVVLKLPDERLFSATSPQGVQFPAEAVEAARQKEGGFQKNTVGSVIAEMYAEKGIEIDKQDPHSALTNGEFSRERQMISAIKEALLKAAKE